MELNQTDVVWLGVAAVVIGTFIRLLKSDTLNDTLDKFGIPPIPKRVLPWMAIAIGVLGGLVNALAAGKTFQAALADALGGLVAGTGAVAGHEVLIESVRNGKEIGH